MKRAKWLTGIFLPALFTTMLLQACENDLNKVKQISALESNSPIDTTKGVDVIYSDSAKVEARVLAPLMLHHTVAKPYYEMPKGVKIIFFDKKLNQMKSDRDSAKHISATVIADYAITSNFDKLIELRKNVVLTNNDGDVFTTQQLFYDINKKIIYSDQPCKLTKIDGTLLDGTSFKSNETFTDYNFEHGKGDIITKGNLLQ
jgi:hypothetical protein